MSGNCCIKAGPQMMGSRQSQDQKRQKNPPSDSYHVLISIQPFSCFIDSHVDGGLQWTDDCKQDYLLKDQRDSPLLHWATDHPSLSHRYSKKK